MDYRLFKGGTKMIDVSLTGNWVLNRDLSVLTRLCVHDRCHCEIKTQKFQVYGQSCIASCPGVSAQ